mgnify:FL=1
MSKLKLNKEEKESIFDYLLENIFDSGHNDEWFLDDPMVKLLRYLNVDVPQSMDVTYSNGAKYTIKLNKDID